MHIALYSPAWPLDRCPNGIVTYVHHLRQALVQRGHRVSVFADTVRGGSAEEGIHRVEPAWLDRRPLRRLYRALQGEPDWGERIAAAVLAVHRRDPIDVLEMEESFGWCDTVRDALPLPVVVKLHGPAFLSLVEQELEGEAAAARIAREGAALRSMPCIMSPSSDTLARTLARYRLAPAQARTVPNLMGVESQFRPWKPEQAEPRTILFVGRFDQRKGGDTMLAAFGRLAAADVRLRLVFVGPEGGVPGPLGQTLGFDACCERHVAPAARARVQYLGALPHSAVFALRAKAAVTVVASRWENQPNTALEAMLQGCPVVCSDAGGLPEIVEDGVSGTLFAAGDDQALAAALRRVLDAPDDAARMAAEGRRRVARRHAPQACVEQTLDVYRGALALAARREPLAHATPPVNAPT